MQVRVEVDAVAESLDGDDDAQIVIEQVCRSPIE
jgi:hypothetical protein